MNIINLNSQHTNSVARLHQEGIKKGFISSLSIEFISRLYYAISQAPASSVTIAVNEKNACIGFIAGTVSTSTMYKWIIPRYGFLFFFQLCLTALNPIKLKNILETLFYTLLKKKDKSDSSANSVEAELLSIVVDSTLRENGTGKKLIASLEEFFIRQNIDTYKVVTWSGDTVSNKFYLSCGFDLASQFSHHGNSMNEYHKKIK